MTFQIRVAATCRLVNRSTGCTAADGIGDRIIFEVGSDRFAIRWSAEMDRLPPAGPVAVERKQRLN